MKKALVSLSMLFAICCYWTCTPTPTPTNPNGSDPAYLHLPTPLSPTTPYDVDTKLMGELAQKGEFAAIDRLFDVLSWQQFIAFNWPVDANGKPKANLSDTGRPIWESWEESFEVFQEDGGAPTVEADYTDAMSALIDTKDKPKSYSAPINRRISTPAIAMSPMR